MRAMMGNRDSLISRFRYPDMWDDNVMEVYCIIYRTINICDLFVGSIVDVQIVRKRRGETIYLVTFLQGESVLGPKHKTKILYVIFVLNPIYHTRRTPPG